MVKTNCSGVAADFLLSDSISDRGAPFASCRIGWDGGIIVVAVGGATCGSAGGPALSMALPVVASSTTDGTAPLLTC